MGSLSYPLILASCGVLIGLLVGFYLRKRVIEGNEKNIKIQSKQIIENAIIEAEQLKKEALLQSKEAAYQVKQALEEELKAEREELKDEQRQLKRKRDNLKREWDSFDRKQNELLYSERRVGQLELEWQEKHKEVDELIGTEALRIGEIGGDQPGRGQKDPHGLP